MVSCLQFQRFYSCFLLASRPKITNANKFCIIICNSVLVFHQASFLQSIPSSRKFQGSSIFLPPSSISVTLFTFSSEQSWEVIWITYFRCRNILKFDFSAKFDGRRWIFTWLQFILRTVCSGWRTLEGIAAIQNQHERVEYDRLLGTEDSMTLASSTTRFQN